MIEPKKKEVSQAETQYVQDYLCAKIEIEKHTDINHLYKSVGKENEYRGFLSQLKSFIKRGINELSK